MKNINKFFAFLMTVGLVFNQSGILPEAKLDSFAEDHGFNLETNQFKDIGHTKALTNALYYYNKRYCKVGSTESYVIFATDRKKPENYRQKNVALYYHVVKPYGILEKNDFYGGSDYLTVVTDLRKKSNINKLLVDKTEPENNAQNHGSYSIGITGSSSKVAGITASETVLKNDIIVKNFSKDKYYYVDYDYQKPGRFERMKDRPYLSGVTKQKGAIEYYTTGAKFTFPITITSSFDVYAGTNVHYGRETVSDTWNISLKS